MDDITSEVAADEKLVEELEKERHVQTVERSVEKNPLLSVESGLNPQLLEMTKRGVNSALFQGVERCIRVLDVGTHAQRHCMSMMVSDTVNGKSCTRCQRRPNPGVCNPKVINSSMIKLNDRELKECGLEKDPSYIPPERNSPEKLAEVIKEPRKARVAAQVAQVRRPKMAVPNAVKIDVSMKDLNDSPDIARLLLEKAIEAIYELPITKFSEAEAIRSTSERIKALLNG